MASVVVGVLVVAGAGVVVGASGAVVSVELAGAVVVSFDSVLHAATTTSAAVAVARTLRIRFPFLLPRGLARRHYVAVAEYDNPGSSIVEAHRENQPAAREPLRVHVATMGASMPAPPARPRTDRVLPIEHRAGDQPVRHSPQPLSTMRSSSTILRTGTEGTDLQYTAGFACDVCDGNADVNVGDGDHYLCAAHAIKPMMEIDLTGSDSVVTVSDAPVSAPNVIMMGARGPVRSAVIGDADIRKLLADVVVGLRAIQQRLESSDIS